MAAEQPEQPLAELTEASSTIALGRSVGLPIPSVLNAGRPKAISAALASDNQYDEQYDRQVVFLRSLDSRPHHKLRKRMGFEERALAGPVAIAAEELVVAVVATAVLEVPLAKQAGTAAVPLVEQAVAPLK